MHVPGFPNHMTATAAARCFGVSRQAISSWQCPKIKQKAGGYVYNLPDVIAWKIEQVREQLAADNAAITTEEEADAIRRKREAEAGLKEAQLGETLGLLVRADEVDQQWGRLLATFRQQLEGLGATMAKRLENKKAKEIADKLNTRIYDLLQDLSEADINTTNEDLPHE